jgi:hypothetical protein
LSKMRLKCGAIAGRANASIRAPGSPFSSASMRVAPPTPQARAPSFRSLGATKAAKTVSAQSNTNAANTQYLLSDAKADIKRQVPSV